MMSYLRRTLACCAVLLVPIACSESADDPQGTGGSSTSESGGGPADGSGGSFASGGAGTGGQATGGDAQEGSGGAANLALEVDGWGTIRCGEIQLDDDSRITDCIAELRGGSTIRVAPLCAIERTDQMPYWERSGSEPNLQLCGQGPDDLGDWDEIICWDYDGVCAGRKGDWLTGIGPECLMTMYRKEITSTDPRFISCASDLSIWDEVRCYADDSDEVAECFGRRDLYWVELFADCRTDEPDYSWTEVDPATVSCDAYDYTYDYDYDYYDE